MIPINFPFLGDEEKNEVLKVLESGQLTTASPDGGFYTQKFQDSVKSFLNVKYVFAVNSGTSALISSLLSLGVKVGDEVLLPSFTFLATVNSVLLIGAKPVFVDIELDHFTIDPIDLEKKVSSKSVALIPVHLYGHPAAMDNILEIGEKHGVSIIEDAAQSLGASYNGCQTGAIADIGCFSMYPSKIITCGEGGFVTTNDDALANRLKLIRNHGIENNYAAVMPGANFRLPQIEASIAFIQMSKLNSFLASRRKNAEILTDLLSGLNGVKLPSEANGAISNWYLYTVTIENKRDNVLKYLHDNGIGAAVYYDPPVHRTQIFSSMSNISLNLPNTEWASKHVISLPVHPRVSEEDLAHIASTLKNAVKSV